MPSILIVDDEQELRNGAAELLQFEGFQVDSAADGDEALSKASHSSFDVALIDLVLPGEYNGLDVITRLRAKSPTTHIIAFTGFSGQNITEKVLKAGANDFMTKPFKADKLLEKIYALMNRGGKPPSRPTPAPAKEEEKGHQNMHEPQEAPINPGNKAFGLFSNIPAEDVELLKQQGRIEEIQPAHGVTVDVAKNLVLIQNGQVRCWYQNSLIGTFKKDDPIGEASFFLLNDASLTVYLESVQESELVIIPRNVLRQYFHQNKILAFRFAANTISSLSQKLMASYEKINYLTNKVRQLSPQNGHKDHDSQTNDAHKKSVDQNV